MLLTQRVGLSPGPDHALLAFVYKERPNVALPPSRQPCPLRPLRHYPPSARTLVNTFNPLLLAATLVVNSLPHWAPPIFDNVSPNHVGPIQSPPPLFILRFFLQ